MKIHCKYTELRNPAELVEHPKNPNKHEGRQIESLAKIIEYQGWRNPIVVSKRSGFVIAGHGRLMAAKKLGVKTVPVDIQPFKDEATEYAHMIADNKIAEFAEMDDSVIAELLEEMPDDFDLELAGLIDGIDLESDQEIEEDEFNEEPPEVPTTKPGQIYKLGRHRLMCGDSTKKADVEKLMDGKFADVTFTSPPYNMGDSIKLSGNTKRAKSGKTYQTHDDDDIDSWRLLMDGFLEVAMDFSSCVICNVQMLAKNKKELVKWTEKHVDSLIDVMVWNKETSAPQMAKSVLNSQFEFLFFLSKSAKSKSIPFSSFHGTVSNVYNGGPQTKNKNSDCHGASMPLHLPEYILGRVVDHSNLIYEPFCGTGTTIIAAEQLNRNCYGMEIDPGYCDVIIKRWEEYTGEKSELVD